MLPYAPHTNPMERRLTLRLMAYWERLRGDRAMPSETEVIPLELSDFWESCFIAQVVDAERGDYRYDYLGNGIMEAYSAGLPALDPGGIVAISAHKLVENYPRVVLTAKPVLEEAEFTSLSGDTIKYRQCLLPLGGDGRVRAILGGMRFRVFPKI